MEDQLTPAEEAELNQLLQENGTSLIPDAIEIDNESNFFRAVKRLLSNKNKKRFFEQFSLLLLGFGRREISEKGKELFMMGYQRNQQRLEQQQRQRGLR